MALTVNEPGLAKRTFFKVGSVFSKEIAARRILLDSMRGKDSNNLRDLQDDVLALEKTLKNEKNIFLSQKAKAGINGRIADVYEQISAIHEKDGNEAERINAKMSEAEARVKEVEQRALGAITAEIYITKKW
ncbi:MAG: hypothetical protein V1909_00240, partial [Candidatus Micrarchaeota archaeon]